MLDDIVKATAGLKNYPYVFFVLKIVDHYFKIFPNINASTILILILLLIIMVANNASIFFG